ARLDRIYVAAPLRDSVYEWDVAPSPFRSDHLLVSLRYAPPTAPELGSGRWTLPLRLTSDAVFLAHVTKSGLALEEDIRRLPDERTADRNVQLLWQKFKTNITAFGQTHVKRTAGKQASRLRKLQADASA
ncbi:hypothetical protein FA95DRAFT_1465218, partial [Auriscalpium vulgare]